MCFFVVCSVLSLAAVPVEVVTHSVMHYTLISKNEFNLLFIVIIIVERKSEKIITIIIMLINYYNNNNIYI